MREIKGMPKGSQIGKGADTSGCYVEPLGVRGPSITAPGTSALQRGMDQTLAA
jgi:hypothetical protein